MYVIVEQVVVRTASTAKSLLGTKQKHFMCSSVREEAEEAIEGRFRSLLEKFGS